MPLALKPSDDGDLVLGHDPGHDVIGVDAHLLGNRPSHRLGIAGDHPRGDVVLDERGDRPLAVGPHRVGHREQPAHRAVPTGGDHRDPVRPQLVRARPQTLGPHQTFISEQTGTADQNQGVLAGRDHGGSNPQPRMVG